MNRYLLILCAALQVATMGVPVAGAQEPVLEADQPVRYEKRFRTDVRFGATWSTTDAGEPVTGGGALTWYPTKAPVLGRMGIYVTVDYRQLDRHVDSIRCESGSPCLSSSAGNADVRTTSATTDHWLATSAGISVEVIRARRFSLEVKRGGGIVRDFTKFAVLQTPPELSVGEAVLAGLFGTGNGTSTRLPEFENQCDSAAFSDRCHSLTVLTSHWGMGLRFFDRTGTAFFGADYSHLRVEGRRDGLHQLVGVFGLRFPFRSVR